MTKKVISLLLLLCLLLTGCTVEYVAPTTSGNIASTEIATSAPAAETTAATEGIDAGIAVHFIDVGQADCALIECGGSFALIDGGNAADGPDVVEYLQKEGVQRLNLVVGTHPHEDHIGGLADVLEAFPADNIWSSPIPYSNSTVESFTDGAADQGISIQYPDVGYTFQLGDAEITVLGPVDRYYEDVNNLSLVLMVQYGDTRFLFTGDMEHDAESDLLDGGADVKADVLKVGHHGSYTSTSYRFLREVAPTYAVISVGAANDYGHPHDEPMSRLRDAEVIIYRTDRMYNIVAISDGENIQFSWDNSYAQPWTPDA